MTIMAHDFAHRGTYVYAALYFVNTIYLIIGDRMKMYKSRITKWGLHKYRKSSSVATAPVKKHRQATRKNPNISLRASSPVLTAITEYLDRKIFRSRQLPLSNSDCSSPSTSSCSGYPLAASLLNDPENFQEYSGATRTSQCLIDHLLPVARSNDMTRAQYDEVFLIYSADVSHNASGAVFSQPLNHIHAVAPVSPSVMLPSSSQLSQERLFACITSYFDSSFGRGIWISQDDEASVSVGASGIVNNDPYKFYNYCRTASQLLAQGSLIQGRQLLSRACGLVQGMLRAADTQTLSRFLDSLMYLEGSGLVGIAAQLQDFIYHMAKRVLPRDRAWYLICRLITRPDPELHLALLAQAWQCVIDALRRSSGEFSMATIQCQVELVNRVYGNKDPHRAERILRDLLRRCEDFHGTNNIVCLKVLVVLGYNLIDQQRPAEAEIVADDVLNRAHNAGPWSRAYQCEAFELAAWAQCCQGKQKMAERNQRKAVEGHAIQWGRDVNVLRRMVILESWLRKWGRIADAQELNREIVELIGPDDEAI